MLPISKELAEREIELLKKQKHPNAYCVARYQYRLTGINFRYIICHEPEHYRAIVRSNFISGISVLWASERFKTDIKKQEQDESWPKAVKPH